MTKVAVSKGAESREGHFADAKDFPDPSDSCDFGFIVTRAPRQGAAIGAKKIAVVQNNRQAR